MVFKTKATIRLFRALPIQTKQEQLPSEELLKETTKRGFVFTPEVVYNYSEQELLDQIKAIEEEIGLTPEQMNSSFQKSWQKVEKAPMVKLVVEQLVHYFTTYGYEQLGIYDKDSVYIPRAYLNIPHLNEDVKIVVIKGYTKEELKDKLIKILNTGIALAEETKKDVLEVAVFSDINTEDISLIRNREVKAVLYDYFELFPENPIEFLRYLLYKTINSTLLIKNEETFEAIKEAVNGRIEIVKLFKNYQEKHGLEKLSEIFFRFKPLFLAYRYNSNLRPIINKLRKLADKHHKPLEQDFLNNITAWIKKGVQIDRKALKKELENCTIFRKIRLAQALNYRTIEDTDSIIYKIRNGKGFATEFCFDKKSKAKEILDIVLSSIIENISKNVQGKKIYIPENITYALPATEKQFTGNIPSGSSITVDKDMIFGIHWKNVKHRIDLDLSLINADKGKIGWDGQYRDEQKTTLFSGDMTDAPEPEGASELFYIKKQEKGNYILFVNYYNYYPKVSVPFKILVAKEQVENFDMNYMVNPNNVLCISKSIMDVKQRMIGLIVVSPEENKFYFNESSLGKSITSSNTDFAENARSYLFDFCENMISLNEVLQKSGAELVEKEENADISLSPESLEKDTILNLLK